MPKGGKFDLSGILMEAVVTTERVKNVTYRAETRGIASGYTQKGNIFYLKQKIFSGGEVNHSDVLVLIHPPSLKNKVLALTKKVEKW